MQELNGFNCHLYALILYKLRMLASTLLTLLRRCQTVNQTKQVHAQLLINGLQTSEQSLLHQLLLIHSDSFQTSSLQYAQQLFDQLPNPDVVSWSSEVRYLSQHGRYREGLSLYLKMHRCGSRPSTFDVSAVLKSCSRISEKFMGIAVHSQVCKYGYACDVYVQTALVDFYSKLGDLETARRVFDEMPNRNVVSWNSILFGYLRNGKLMEAQNVFDEILVKDVVSWNSMISGYAKAGDMVKARAMFEQTPERNPATWNSMISGYVDFGDMVTARKLFDEMPERSLVSWITMISGYSKCGDVDSARGLFDQMEEYDLLSWNAMIACYAQNSQPKEALLLFNKMRKPNVNLRPDEMTLSSVISACSQLGDLRFGLWLEEYMKRIGIKLDDHLATALIDLYAKCGVIDKAYELFHSLRRKDVVAYSAMILGCGINGKAFDAIKLFEKMIESNIIPNAVTFTGILTAYNHAGMVEEAYRCFSSMTSDHGVLPSSDHYGILVDLLGRAGRLEAAHSLINNMPMRPHAGVWGALLLACRLHGNVELGEIAAQHCIELEPETSGYYSLLANIYASAERWDDAKRLRRVMEEKGLIKIPGCSWTGSN